MSRFYIIKYILIIMTTAEALTIALQAENRTAWFNILLKIVLVLGIVELIQMIFRGTNRLIKRTRRDGYMNTIEKLLAYDAGKIKVPEKVVSMRLKQLGNQKFDFPCKAVDPEYVSELQENSIEFKKGDIEKIKMYDTKVMTIIEGCPTIFKSEELLRHFKVRTPKELIKVLMVSGEIDKLKEEIDKLSGYDDDEKNEDDIKN